MLSTCWLLLIIIIIIRIRHCNNLIIISLTTRYAFINKGGSFFPITNGANPNGEIPFKWESSYNKSLPSSSSRFYGSEFKRSFDMLMYLPADAFSCLLMYHPVCWCIILLVDVSSCLLMYHPVCWCIILFVDVSSCLLMFLQSYYIFLFRLRSLLISLLNQRHSYCHG